MVGRQATRRTKRIRDFQDARDNDPDGEQATGCLARRCARRPHLPAHHAGGVRIYQNGSIVGEVYRQEDILDAGRLSEDRRRSVKVDDRHLIWAEAQRLVDTHPFLSWWLGAPTLAWRPAPPVRSPPRSSPVRLHAIDNRTVSVRAQ